MIIPSLKRFASEDLDLLYVDAMQQWAKHPDATRHADLAVAISDELERRGQKAPEEQVRAETEYVLAIAVQRMQHLREGLGL